VTHVIQRLQKHKAAGTDQIVAEFFKKKEDKPYGEESATLSNWSGHNIKYLKTGLQELYTLYTRKETSWNVLITES